MVWLATDSVESVMDAEPLARFCVPRLVPVFTGPSQNVAVPLGVRLPGGTAGTFAVNVTVWPHTADATDGVTVTWTLFLLTVIVKVWEALVSLPPLAVPPLSLAVTVTWATPLTW